jgi:hypothetical protein
MHAPAMAKLLQVRDVPDDVQRRLKVRAAQARTSPSEYVLADGASVHAPDLMNVEVLHVIRRSTISGAIATGRAESMRDDLADLPSTSISPRRCSSSRGRCATT